MKKTLAIALVLAAIAAFWLAVSQFFTLQDIQRIARSAKTVSIERPLLVFLALAFSQSIGMALSIPTKALLTLLSGALLGPLWGSASTLLGVVSGTTALFFTARYLLRNQIRQKLGNRAQQIEERLARHPVRALVGLRLFITLPYGPITLAAALTSMRYRHFIAGSIIGDLPVIVSYCFAGRELLALTSVSEAVSPWTVVTLVVVGVFILVTALMGRAKRNGR
jgi:uncharacterized membrane protein YdjX (TVP38/TMEM64 family)